MHGKIYQIDTKPIRREEYIDTAKEGEMMVSFDYVSETKEEERRQFIRDLVERVLPEGMFTVDTDGETLIFQGGFDKWKHRYLELVRSKMAAIDEDNIMDCCGPVYQLQKAIVNPMGCNAYFVTDYCVGAIAVHFRDFMVMVEGLEPYAKLYVGAILDYHG